MDPADAEKLDILDQTIDNNKQSIVQMNKSITSKEEAPAPLLQANQGMSEQDILEMEKFNNKPQEKLGGISLSMIQNAKLQDRII